MLSLDFFAFLKEENEITLIILTNVIGGQDGWHSIFKGMFMILDPIKKLIMRMHSLLHTVSLKLVFVILEP